MDGVTKVSHGAPRKICGVGYVVLSRAQDRDTYIGSCFRNNMVTIITDENEIVPKCIIGKNAWQYLEFPTTVNQRGSALVWLNIPHQNKIVVLDVLHKRDELNAIQSTGQFKLQRAVGSNVVTVQGDGTTGVINIIAQGSVDGEGEMYIKILNENELAVFNLFVQGTATVTVETELDFNVGQKLQFTIKDESNPQNQAILNYILGTGLSYLDEFSNNVIAKVDGLHLEPTTNNKVYARATGAASQPGLLGNNTYILLNEIKNLLTSMVTTLQTASASGTYVAAAPVTAAVTNWLLATQKMQQEISNIKANNFELS